MLTKYDKYKEHKKSFVGLKYRNVNLASIANSALARGIWKGKKSLLSLLVKEIRFNSPKRDFDTLVTYTCGSRLDHVEKLKAYCKKKNISSDSLVEINRVSAESYIHYVNVLRYLIIASCKLIVKNRKINLIDLVSVAYSLNAISTLKKLDLNFENYIAYNSSDLEEACLSEIHSGKNTLGLQHGMYYEYQNDVPMDIINFENVAAKKIILWGQYSKDQIKNYLPESTSVELSYDFALEKQSPSTIKYDSILILLPRAVYTKEINDLLNIVYNLSCHLPYEIFVKPHPTLYNDKVLIDRINNDFTIFELPLENALSQYKFSCVIGFNSTTVFESILFEQNTFVFRSGNDEFFLPIEISFTNNEQLEKLILRPSFGKVNSEYYFYLDNSD